MALLKKKSGTICFLVLIYLYGITDGAKLLLKLIPWGTGMDEMFA
jgi:hypothetical protein